MSESWIVAPFRRFVAALESERLAHAWLIGGPAGLGKRALAERIVGTLLCQNRRGDGEACGQCRGCHFRRAGTHPDLYRVGLELNDRGTARSEIVIEQVRTLCERLAQTSHAGGRRVALIDPADALNLSSVNALLKTLEEPPAAVVMLLVADQPSRLLPTVRSRCQRLDVRIPEAGEALAWLGSQDIAEASARRALALAAGNPGEALTIARNEALVDGVLEDLLALRGRGAIASEVARRWYGDKHVKTRLDMALQLSRVAMAALASGSGAGDPRIRRLTEGLEVAQLSERFNQLGRLRTRLAAPLRHELLLLDWLRQWMPGQLTARHAHLRGS